MSLRWSWDVKRLRVYMNWALPTGMRILRKGSRR